MKPRYERPVLMKHEVGAANKFGAQPALRVYNRFENVPIADLVAQYGSPLVLFSERVLRERYRELRDQMAARVPRFTIACRTRRTTWARFVACCIRRARGPRW